MLGAMMDKPLLISSLITHAEAYHSGTEIVSVETAGGIERTSWGEVASNARRLASALEAMGLGFSDRVATIAWNNRRHLELYFGVSGAGMVLHTINPRLFADQITYIVNHAEDRVLFFDATFLPLIAGLHEHLTAVRAFVLMGPRDEAAAAQVPGLLFYDEVLERGSDAYVWPVFDELSASSLCYTSGTTGNPKGVLYSHRSTLLHTFMSNLRDMVGLSASDTVLPVVPMFHVNAWGMPYAACMVGAKLVFPGPALDGKSLYEIFEAEGVTVSAGVPTVWQGLLAHVEANGLKFSTMKRTVIGGSACPPAMIRAFEDRFGVTVLHGWGMTEMSPLGTVCAMKGGQEGLDDPAAFAVKSKQGRAIFGVDMKLTGADGAELPWDGQTQGELMVRGPWVLDRYFNRDENPLRYDAAGLGWFPTGDVSTIDADGFMQVVDRTKDVIKSGGEWIGSIDLENIAMAHPAVAMAACIAARHPKWDERPLLLVVLKPGAVLSREAMLEFFEGKVAKWWIPDDVVFVDEIPLGATGKMQKNKLRDDYGDRLMAG